MISGPRPTANIAAIGVGNSAVISSVASIEGSRPGSARTTGGSGVVTEESVGAALVDDDGVTVVVGTTVVAPIAADQRLTIQPCARGDERNQGRRPQLQRLVQRARWRSYGPA
jgi:hypothetical protein